MQSTYIDQENDAYRVAGTRISLDSLIYAYLNGHTAEAIAQAFPLLTLEQVHGALAYYLAHRQMIDAALISVPADRLCMVCSQGFQP